MKQFVTLLLIAAASQLNAQRSDGSGKFNTPGGQRKMATFLSANGSYTYSESIPTINFPAKDLADMYALMKDFKIDTQWRSFNFSRKEDFFNEMKSCRNNFQKRGITDIVVYYSGHGAAEQGGESFLLPTSFNPLGLPGLYDNSNADVALYIQKITQEPVTPAERLLKKRLQYYNLIHNCVSISQLCNEMKEFNLLFISDACRSPITQVDKGGLDPLAAPVGDEKDLKDWLETQGKPKKQRKEQFVQDFRDFYNRVNTEINSFDSVCVDFNRNMTQDNGRRPATILFGTNYYNTAAEITSIFSSAFTNCFLKLVPSIKASTIDINDKFVTELAACLDSKQKPVLEGVRTFNFKNPYLREQQVNIANCTKAIEDQGFKAIGVNYNTAKQKSDLLLGNKTVKKIYTTAFLKSIPGFEKAALVDSVAEWKIEVKVRMPLFMVQFINKRMMLSYEQEIIIPPFSCYKVNTETNTLELNDELIALANTAPYVFMESDNKSTEYDIINDSTLKPGNTMNIPSFISFSQIKIKRISTSWDTLDIELPSLYEPDAGFAIRLLQTKFLKTNFTGTLINYNGRLDQEGNKHFIIGPSSNSNFTNLPLAYKWKNGKYRISVNLALDIDRVVDSLPAEEQERMDNEFLALTVNDISKCRDPESPKSDTGACDVHIKRSYFGLRRFRITKFSQLHTGFELKVPDPTTKQISLPISSAYSKYIREAIVSSITIEPEELYDPEQVKAYFDSLRKEEIMQLSAAAKIKLEADRKDALAKRVNELKDYLTGNYASLFLRNNEAFEKDQNNYYYDEHSKTNIDSYEYKNEQLNVAAGNVYFFRSWGQALPANYQMEAELRFSSSTRNMQRFTWDGYHTGNNNYGYYLSPYREGSGEGAQYFLRIGYQEAGDTKIIGDINLSGIDHNAAREFCSGVSFARLTIRKYNDEFYIFFNRRFAGTITDTEKKPRGDAFILDNNAPATYYVSDNKIIPRQLRYSGVLSARSVKLSEIIEKVPF